MWKDKEANQWRAVTAGAVVFFLLSSCANTGGGSGAGGENIGKMLGTLGGAAVGAAVGGATGGKYSPLIGAAIGAAVGYAAGYALDSYRVSQNKDAAEVNAEYKQEHEGQLPAETVVTKYETKTDPSGMVSRGEKLDIISQIEMVRGANSTGNDRVDEELTIYDASGKNTKKLKKQALSQANSSGGYVTRFTFRPTQEVSQGTYPYRTVLYLNDEPVRESEGKIQIVMVGNELKMAILE
jgi:hypothetical protein